MKLSEMALTPSLERFVLHWGDLGATWGVNRSVAQVQALLLVADRPLNAEQIADILKIARSNVSTCLRELLEIGLARRAPVLGDRRDHFEAEGDAWEIAARIAAVRKAREIDPAAAVLKSCLAAAEQDPAASPQAVARLKDLAGLVDTLDQWFAQMIRIPKAQLTPLIRLGGKVVELLAPFLKKS